MSGGWLVGLSVVHALLGGIAALINMFATAGVGDRRSRLGQPPGEWAWVGDASIYAVPLAWVLSLAVVWWLHRQGAGWPALLIYLLPYGLFAAYLWQIERFV